MNECLSKSNPIYIFFSQKLAIHRSFMNMFIKQITCFKCFCVTANFIFNTEFSLGVVPVVKRHLFRPQSSPSWYQQTEVSLSAPVTTLLWSAVLFQLAWFFGSLPPCDGHMWEAGKGSDESIGVRVWIPGLPLSDFNFRQDAYISVLPFSHQ